MPKLSKETLDFRALKPDYVCEVLKNMPNTDNSLTELCFGTSGDGFQPNYEIRPAPGQRIPYWGNTHKQNKDRTNWEDHNLTEPFSRAEVERGFDISLKSDEVAKKYIWDKLKGNPKQFPRPNAKQLPLLIAAVMNGTPIEKAFADLHKVQVSSQPAK
jgi:hypothetical protein